MLLEDLDEVILVDQEFPKLNDLLQRVYGNNDSADEIMDILITINPGLKDIVKDDGIRGLLENTCQKIGFEIYPYMVTEESRNYFYDLFLKVFKITLKVEGYF